MFDILGIVNFRGTQNLGSLENLFLQNDYYNDLKFKHCSYRSNISNVYVLEKNETTDNTYTDANMHLFLFGSCFTNKHYEYEFAESPRKLTIKDILGLYNKYEDGLVKYLKGMFTIIIIDVKKEVIKLISDRTNLMPLYYYFRDNVLLFSSSMNQLLDYGFIDKKVNERAIAKIAIFNYITGNETIISNIFMQLNASIITIRENKLSEKRYWSLADIYTQPRDRLKQNDALEKCNQLLKEIVNMYISDQKYFAVTFTGGYDSRTILSVLDRNKKDFFCYSYGKKGCYDIQIPQKISDVLGIDFRKFYLDGAFETDFEKYAFKAVYFSDGLGAITRANFVYPCNEISDSVDIILTGLFGSEMIKQPASLGYYINAQVKNLFFSNSPHKIFNKLIEAEVKKGYLCKDVFRKYKEDIFNELYERYFSKKSAKFNFYNFLIQEGIRKYFMQELKMERVYVENRHPFLDDDFIELLFKTPFAGIYNIKRGKNIIMARKTHQLYASLINKNNPQLAKFRTTHGYKPIDILSNFRMIKVLFDYYHYKNIVKKSKTFAYEKLVNGFCKKYMSELKFHDRIFSDAIKTKYNDNEHLSNLEEFSKFFSLKLWLWIHKL